MFSVFPQKNEDSVWKARKRVTRNVLVDKEQRFICPKYAVRRCRIFGNFIQTWQKACDRAVGSVFGNACHAYVLEAGSYLVENNNICSVAISKRQVVLETVWCSRGRRDFAERPACEVGEDPPGRAHAGRRSVDNNAIVCIVIASNSSSRRRVLLYTIEVRPNFMSMFIRGGSYRNQKMSVTSAERLTRWTTPWPSSTTNATVSTTWTLSDMV